MTTGEDTAGAPLVIIHSSDEWYGADRMVAELAEVAAGVADGVEVWLPDDSPAKSPSLSTVLAGKGIVVRPLPLPVIRRKSLTPGGLVALVRQTVALRAILRQSPPSVVVAATTAVAPALWALPRATRSLLYVQEIWRSGERVVLGFLGRPAQAVMAISEPVASALPGRMRRRTTVVVNAVADSPNPPVEIPAEGPVTFVVASRWNSWKGHSFLLQAWEEAGCPGRLIVLGGAPAAGIGVDVAVLAAGVSHPKTVEVVGEVDDILPWLDRAHVLVLPSTNPEPFGLVVVEAFARARPVIATAHGAPATVVRDDVGWLVEPGDVEGLAKILGSITIEEARRKGLRARLLFQREYSMEAWRSAASALLRTVVPIGSTARTGRR